MKPTHSRQALLLFMSLILTRSVFADPVSDVKQQIKQSSAVACQPTQLTMIKNNIVDDPGSVTIQAILLGSYVTNATRRINAAQSCVASIQGAAQLTEEDKKNPDVVQYKQDALSAAAALQGRLQAIQGSLGTNVNLSKDLEDTPVEPKELKTIDIGIRG